MSDELHDEERTAGAAASPTANPSPERLSPGGQASAGQAAAEGRGSEHEVEAPEPSSSGGHLAGRPDVDELLARLQDAEAKRDELLGDLRRVAADFDNYRKRTAREHEQLVRRAGERIVARLLPVLDDLGRALEAAEHHEEAKVIEGVRMTRDQLAALLAAEGVEEIPVEGAFDPHVHEAIAAQPGEGVPSGDVLHVVQAGYRLGDVVIRPARVVVAE